MREYSSKKVLRLPLSFHFFVHLPNYVKHVFININGIPWIGQYECKCVCVCLPFIDRISMLGFFLYEFVNHFGCTAKKKLTLQFVLPTAAAHGLLHIQYIFSYYKSGNDRIMRRLCAYDNNVRSTYNVYIYVLLCTNNNSM